MMHSAVPVLLLSLIASIYCQPTTVPTTHGPPIIRNFQLSDCTKATSEDSTSCNHNFIVHHWNDEKQDCETTSYNGCHPTENLFRSNRECVVVATPICKRKITKP